MSLPAPHSKSKLLSKPPVSFRICGHEYLLVVHDFQEVVVDGIAAVSATDCAVDRDPNGLIRGVSVRSNAAAVAATPPSSAKAAVPRSATSATTPGRAAKGSTLTGPPSKKMSGQSWRTDRNFNLGGVASLMSMGIARLCYVTLACEGWGRAPAGKRHQ